MSRTVSTGPSFPTRLARGEPYFPEGAAFIEYRNGDTWALLAVWDPHDPYESMYPDNPPARQALIHPDQLEFPL